MSEMDKSTEIYLKTSSSSVDFASSSAGNFNVTEVSLNNSDTKFTNDIKNLSKFEGFEEEVNENIFNNIVLGNYSTLCAFCSNATSLESTEYNLRSTDTGQTGIFDKNVGISEDTKETPYTIALPKSSNFYEAESVKENVFQLEVSVILATTGGKRDETLTTNVILNTTKFSTSTDKLGTDSKNRNITSYRGSTEMPRKMGSETTLQEEVGPHEKQSEQITIKVSTINTGDVSSNGHLTNTETSQKSTVNETKSVTFKIKFAIDTEVFDYYDGSLTEQEEETKNEYGAFSKKYPKKYSTTERDFLEGTEETMNTLVDFKAENTTEAFNQSHSTATTFEVLDNLLQTNSAKTITDELSSQYEAITSSGIVNYKYSRSNTEHKQTEISTQGKHRETLALPENITKMITGIDESGTSTVKKTDRNETNGENIAKESHEVTYAINDVPRIGSEKSASNTFADKDLQKTATHIVVTKPKSINKEKEMTTKSEGTKLRKTSIKYTNQEVSAKEEYTQPKLHEISSSFTATQSFNKSVEEKLKEKEETNTQKTTMEIKVSGKIVTGLEGTNIQTAKSSRLQSYDHQVNPKYSDIQSFEKTLPVISTKTDEEHSSTKHKAGEFTSAMTSTEFALQRPKTNVISSEETETQITVSDVLYSELSTYRSQTGVEHTYKNANEKTSPLTSTKLTTEGSENIVTRFTGTDKLVTSAEPEYTFPKDKTIVSSFKETDKLQSYALQTDEEYTTEFTKHDEIQSHDQETHGEFTANADEKNYSSQISTEEPQKYIISSRGIETVKTPNGLHFTGLTSYVIHTDEEYTHGKTLPITYSRIYENGSEEMVTTVVQTDTQLSRADLKYQTDQEHTVNDLDIDKDEKFTNTKAVEKSSTTSSIAPSTKISETIATRSRPTDKPTTSAHSDYTELQPEQHQTDEEYTVEEVIEKTFPLAETGITKEGLDKWVTETMEQISVDDFQYTEPQFYDQTSVEYSVGKATEETFSFSFTETNEKSSEIITRFLEIDIPTSIAGLEYSELQSSNNEIDAEYTVTSSEETETQITISDTDRQINKPTSADLEYTELQSHDYQTVEEEVEKPYYITSTENTESGSDEMATEFIETGKQISVTDSEFSETHSNDNQIDEEYSDGLHTDEKTSSLSTVVAEVSEKHVTRSKQTDNQLDQENTDRKAIEKTASVATTESTTEKSSEVATRFPKIHTQPQPHDTETVEEHTYEKAVEYTVEKAAEYTVDKSVEYTAKTSIESTSQSPEKIVPSSEETESQITVSDIVYTELNTYDIHTNGDYSSKESVEKSSEAGSGKVASSSRQTDRPITTAHSEYTELQSYEYQTNEEYTVEVEKTYLNMTTKITEEGSSIMSTKFTETGEQISVDDLESTKLQSYDQETDMKYTDEKANTATKGPKYTTYSSEEEAKKTVKDYSNLDYYYEQTNDEGYIEYTKILSVGSTSGTTTTKTSEGASAEVYTRSEEMESHENTSAGTSSAIVEELSEIIGTEIEEIHTLETNTARELETDIIGTENESVILESSIDIENDDIYEMIQKDYSSVEDITETLSTILQISKTGEHTRKTKKTTRGEGTIKQKEVGTTISTRKESTNVETTFEISLPKTIEVEELEYNVFNKTIGITTESKEAYDLLKQEEIDKTEEEDKEITFTMKTAANFRTKVSTEDENLDSVVFLEEEDKYSTSYLKEDVASKQSLSNVKEKTEFLTSKIIPQTLSTEVTSPTSGPLHDETADSLFDISGISSETCQCNTTTISSTNNKKVSTKEKKRTSLSELNEDELVDQTSEIIAVPSYLNEEKTESLEEEPKESEDMEIAYVTDHNVQGKSQLSSDYITKYTSETTLKHKGITKTEELYSRVKTGQEDITSIEYDVQEQSELTNDHTTRVTESLSRVLPQKGITETEKLDSEMETELEEQDISYSTEYEDQEQSMLATNEYTEEDDKEIAFTMKTAANFRTKVSTEDENLDSVVILEGEDKDSTSYLKEDVGSKQSVSNVKEKTEFLTSKTIPQTLSTEVTSSTNNKKVSIKEKKRTSLSELNEDELVDQTSEIFEVPSYLNEEKTEPLDEEPKESEDMEVAYVTDHNVQGKSQLSSDYITKYTSETTLKDKGITKTEELYSRVKTEQEDIRIRSSIKYDVQEQSELTNDHTTRVTESFSRVLPQKEITETEKLDSETETELEEQEISYSTEYEDQVQSMLATNGHSTHITQLPFSGTKIHILYSSMETSQQERELEHSVDYDIQEQSNPTTNENTLQITKLPSELATTQKGVTETEELYSATEIEPEDTDITYFVKYHVEEESRATISSRTTHGTEYSSETTDTRKGETGTRKLDSTIETVENLTGISYSIDYDVQEQSRLTPTEHTLHSEHSSDLTSKETKSTKSEKLYSENEESREDTESSDALTQNEVTEKDKLYSTTKTEQEETEVDYVDREGKGIKSSHHASHITDYSPALALTRKGDTETAMETERENKEISYAADYDIHEQSQLTTSAYTTNMTEHPSKIPFTQERVTEEEKLYSATKAEQEETEVTYLVDYGDQEGSHVTISHLSSHITDHSPELTVTQKLVTETAVEMEVENTEISDVVDIQEHSQLTTSVYTTNITYYSPGLTPTQKGVAETAMGTEEENTEIGEEKEKLHSVTTTEQEEIEVDYGDNEGSRTKSSHHTTNITDYSRELTQKEVTETAMETEGKNTEIGYVVDYDIQEQSQLPTIAHTTNITEHSTKIALTQKALTEKEELYSATGAQQEETVVTYLVDYGDQEGSHIKISHLSTHIIDHSPELSLTQKVVEYDIQEQSQLTTSAYTTKVTEYSSKIIPTQKAVTEKEDLYSATGTEQEETEVTHHTPELVFTQKGVTATTMYTGGENTEISQVVDYDIREQLEILTTSVYTTNITEHSSKIALTQEAVTQREKLYSATGAEQEEAEVTYLVDYGDQEGSHITISHISTHITDHSPELTLTQNVQTETAMDTVGEITEVSDVLEYDIKEQSQLTTSVYATQITEHPSEIALTQKVVTEKEELQSLTGTEQEETEVTYHTPELASTQKGVTETAMDKVGENTETGHIVDYDNREQFKQLTTSAYTTNITENSSKIALTQEAVTQREGLYSTTGAEEEKEEITHFLDFGTQEELQNTISNYNTHIEHSSEITLSQEGIAQSEKLHSAMEATSNHTTALEEISSEPDITQKEIESLHYGREKTNEEIGRPTDLMTEELDERRTKEEMGYLNLTKMQTEETIQHPSVTEEHTKQTHQRSPDAKVTKITNTVTEVEKLFSTSEEEKDQDTEIAYKTEYEIQRPLQLNTSSEFSDITEPEIIRTYPSSFHTEGHSVLSDLSYSKGYTEKISTSLRIIPSSDFNIYTQEGTTHIERLYPSHTEIISRVSTISPTDITGRIRTDITGRIRTSHMQEHSSPEKKTSTIEFGSEEISSGHTEKHLTSKESSHMGEYTSNSYLRENTIFSSSVFQKYEFTMPGIESDFGSSTQYEKETYATSTQSSQQTETQIEEAKTDRTTINPIVDKTYDLQASSNEISHETLQHSIFSLNNKFVLTSGTTKLSSDVVSTEISCLSECISLRNTSTEGVSNFLTEEMFLTADNYNGTVTTSESGLQSRGTTKEKENEELKTGSQGTMFEQTSETSLITSGVTVEYITQTLESYVQNQTETDTNIVGIGSLSISKVNYTQSSTTMTGSHSTVTLLPPESTASQVRTGTIFGVETMPISKENHTQSNTTMTDSHSTITLSELSSEAIASQIETVYSAYSNTESRSRKILSTGLLSTTHFFAGNMSTNVEDFFTGIGNETQKVSQETITEMTSTIHNKSLLTQTDTIFNNVSATIKSIHPTLIQDTLKMPQQINTTSVDFVSTIHLLTDGLNMSSNVGELTTSSGNETQKVTPDTIIEMISSVHNESIPTLNNGSVTIKSTHTGLLRLDSLKVSQQINTTSPALTTSEEGHANITTQDIRMKNFTVSETSEEPIKPPVLPTDVLQNESMFSELHPLNYSSDLTPHSIFTSERPDTTSLNDIGIQNVTDISAIREVIEKDETHFLSTSKSYENVSKEIILSTEIVSNSTLIPFGLINQQKDFLETVTEAYFTSHKSSTKSEDKISTTTIKISRKGMIITPPDQVEESSSHEYMKPLVLILNGSEAGGGKFNLSLLSKFLNDSNYHMKYVDLHKISKEIATEKQKTDLSTTEKNILKEFLPHYYKKSCTKSDFVSNKGCICNIDRYVRKLRRHPEQIIANEYDCNDFVSLSGGIIIGKDSEHLGIRKRSLLYKADIVTQINSTKETEIDDIFQEDFEIIQKDGEIFGILGTSIKIPCRNKADSLFGNNGFLYTWKFTSDVIGQEKKIPGENNMYVINKLTTEDAGNYTCTKSSKTGTVDEYPHRLEVLSFPIHTVKMDIYYFSNGSCSLSDVDVLYEYLPKIFDPLICGQSIKICSVNIDRPKCSSKDDGSLFNLTVSAVVNQITDIIKIEESGCDIKCGLTVSANLIGLIGKNVENLQRVSVFSNLGPVINFLTNISTDSVTAVSPKLETACMGGFGLEKSSDKICVVCPKQTFSDENQAYCKPCPLGYYQPKPGSKSCMACSSPLDDSLCLRMLYADSKVFKIYAGVGFGTAVLAIIVIIYWKSFDISNKHRTVAPFEGSQRHRASRKTRDVEKAVLEPLLTEKNVIQRKVPPEVPDPDF